MVNILRFRVVLTGFAGAPGVNTFYGMTGDLPIVTAGNIGEFSDALHGLYETLNGNLATGVRATPELAVSEFEEGTGVLIQEHQLDVPAWTVTAGTATSRNSHATHAKFRYRTGVPVGQRLLKGGIYFGPLDASGAVDIDGAITSQFRDAAVQAHNPFALIETLKLCVWHQPRNGTGGVAHTVQTVDVMPVPAVLRSRRD